MVPGGRGTEVGTRLSSQQLGPQEPGAGLGLGFAQQTPGQTHISRGNRDGPSAVLPVDALRCLGLPGRTCGQLGWRMVWSPGPGQALFS